MDGNCCEGALSAEEPRPALSGVCTGTVECRIKCRTPSATRTWMSCKSPWDSVGTTRLSRFSETHTHMRARATLFKEAVTGKRAEKVSPSFLYSRITQSWVTGLFISRSLFVPAEGSKFATRFLFTQMTRGLSNIAQRNDRLRSVHRDSIIGRCPAIDSVIRMIDASSRCRPELFRGRMLLENRREISLPSHSSNISGWRSTALPYREGDSFREGKPSALTFHAKISRRRISIASFAGCENARAQIAQTCISVRSTSRNPDSIVKISPITRKMDSVLLVARVCQIRPVTGRISRFDSAVAHLD